MKTRTFLIVMTILIGVVIAAHVHYLNMHTWHYPFSFKIDNVEMRQIAFGVDSSSTKKYILAIKFRDCDVRTVNYSMRGYPNGIKDSVKQITIIDKNGSDITNSFDCVVVDRKSWQNEESELDHEYNWTKVSNLKNILNSIKGDITLFEEHNDSTRWINAVYTIDSHIVPKELTFELEHRSLKCEIKDLQQQKKKRR